MDMQNKDYKEILLKILEAINFTEDKEAFINQFANIIFLQSLADLIQSSSDQEKIKLELLASDKTPDKIEELIRKYFTEEQKMKALELAAKNAIVDYISEIQNTLSPAQEQNLYNLFQQMNHSA